MYSRTLILSVLLLMMTTGCSSLERVVYRPNLHQGNYLDASNVSKLQTGMSKEQVLYTLGTPMLSDPFGEDIWYYVFLDQSGREKAKQQTLTLTFDKEGNLDKIDNVPMTTLEGDDH
jgi:outer membrane protein assembly factor BamE